LEIEKIVCRMAILNCFVQNRKIKVIKIGNAKIKKANEFGN
jgi:hypothetical protein